MVSQTCMIRIRTHTQTPKHAGTNTKEQTTPEVKRSCPALSLIWLCRCAFCLAGQAFGARNYSLVGITLQRGILVAWTLCVPMVKPTLPCIQHTHTNMRILTPHACKPYACLTCFCASALFRHKSQMLCFWLGHACIAMLVCPAAHDVTGYLVVEHWARAHSPWNRTPDGWHHSEVPTHAQPNHIQCSGCGEPTKV